MEVGAYDEDWRRTARWLRASAQIFGRNVRRRRFRDVATLPIVMIVNPVVVALGHRWRRRACPCCGWEGASFLWSAHGVHVSTHATCPHCESRGRHRALTLLIPSTVPPERVTSILHFAPEALLSDSLRRAYPEAEYRTIDLLRTDVDLPGEDLQRLTLADASFDLVVCNHVLEHVPDDTKAIAELARVTRAGGVAFVTVPGWWDGRPTEVYAEPDDNGHHRDYGNDLADHLRASFDEVEQVTADDITGDVARYGLQPGEPIFVCRR